MVFLLKKDLTRLNNFVDNNNKIYANDWSLDNVIHDITFLGCAY